MEGPSPRYSCSNETASYETKERSKDRAEKGKSKDKFVAYIVVISANVRPPIMRGAELAQPRT
jgi:hypothetical protein